MVGHSGSGKASFMAGLYKYVGEDPENYGISSKNETQKRQLARMASALTQGKYPSGTDVQQRYEFAFTVAGHELMPFNWIDYRGGILLSDDPDESDMNKFMSAIKSADALVVFLDGEKLIQQGARWNMEYDILISCIESSLTVSHNSWFPISFVITKCDIVPDGAEFYGLSRFHSLFSQIEKSQSVGAMLVQCAITKELYHIPFFVLAYSIYGGSPIYINRCVEAYDAAMRRAEAHRPTSLLGRVFGGVEQILSEIAEIVDMDWETEYDKTWAAEYSAQKQEQLFNQLNLCKSELEEKLKSWSKDDLVTIF